MIAAANGAAATGFGVPEFSIITCTFNSMPFLKECIDSVLAQGHRDFEWIFVDGGSTDGTLELITALPRPYKLLPDVGGGISAAMNAGIEAATGRYICHLHSDDFFVRPDALSLVSCEFRTTSKQWGFGRSMAVKQGRLLEENFRAPRYSKSALVRGNFIPHPATFVARELFQKVGNFDLSLSYAMDYDLWLRLAVIADPFTLNIPLAAMREHPGSASTRNKVDAVREDFRIRLRHTRGALLPQLLHRLRYLVRLRRAVLEASA